MQSAQGQAHANSQMPILMLNLGLNTDTSTVTAQKLEYISNKILTCGTQNNLVIIKTGV